MDTEQTKKEYEISFLLREEGDLAILSQKITQHGGELLSEGSLKRLALSYPIKKEDQAFFGTYRFKMEPLSLQALDKDLKVGSPVLRFLIVSALIVKPRINITREKGTTAPQSPLKTASPEKRPSLPLSNEALEKKIEEILQ